MLYQIAKTIFGSAIVLSFLPSNCGSRFDPNNVPVLKEPPTKILNVTELITRYGYKPQQYKVTTEDGYILGITRIMNRKGPPVLMVNGLALGPELLVLHGPGHDLAFVLSDLGYDVWLGVQRGMVGSDKHINSTISPKDYWNFSHDESGYYDLPAMIDLILAVTAKEKLLYVGTSLGGTLFMVMCSERPEYCSKVSGNVQLAPAMWISQRNELLKATQLYLELLKRLLTLLGEVKVYNLPLRPLIFTWSMVELCGTHIAEPTCFELLHSATGFNKPNMARGWLGISLAFTVSGTSTRQVEHLIQLTRKGGVRKYDWGHLMNMVKYKSPVPPSYNLTRITSPTVIYYSKKDWLISYPAMKKTISFVGNLKFAKDVSESSYGHAEFVFGKDLYKLLFSDIVDFFDSVSGKSNSVI